MAVQPVAHRFTVDEYHRMAEAGIFGEDDRIELLEGEIVDMTPIGSRHAACVNGLTRLFVEAAGDRAIVSVQNPLRLGDRSEPQPDLLLLRPRADDYRGALPEGGDVLVLIEVGDSTAAFDARVKLPLYAAAGIREVWLVNVGDGTIEVCSDPTGRDYRSRQVYGRGATVAPEALPQAAVNVATLLPEG
ncbi:MAG TPA: Uma2 family endonuclease [Acidimicrobiales bacterium]|nr:Uma2 family endonuclease [Acidimicrobiales bacterium]